MGGVGKGLPTRVEHTDGMDRVLVRPNGPLTGEVAISGAKNSALLLMAATLLAPGEHVLTNVPRIADVATMVELLGAIGVECGREGTTIALRTPDELHPEAPYELVERMRASIGVLGPLLARCGEARVALPGGDDFGTRPIDMHLSGLEAMGATFELAHGYVEARPTACRGAPVTLEFPSVGATENILMAAVLAKGTTVIDNAAREPEIADLADLLNAMGAQIEGAGTSTIEVEGVDVAPRRRARDDPRPHRGRDVPRRGRDRRRRGAAAARARRPHGDVPPQARRHGRDGHAHARRPLGARTAAPAVGRRVDAAVPGLRHRLHAACSP